MECKIGDDDAGGIILAFDGEMIRVEEVETGWLTVGEARLAADILRVMADHMEASYNGD